MLPIAEIANQSAQGRVVIICEHAGNKLPKQFGNLGLDAKLFETHIAYDIGAREVAIALAQSLDGVCVFANYSRLLVDLNRHSDDFCCVREISDRLIIPGNQNIDDKAHKARIEAYHEKFHQSVDGTIATQRQKFDDGVIAVINVHSFTPQLSGQAKRPWDIGMLTNHDRRIGQALLDGFATHYPQYYVGDNQPYSGMAAFNYTCTRHAINHGLAHVAIEYSQGELSSASGVQKWVECTSVLMQPILQDPRIMQLL